MFISLKNTTLLTIIGLVIVVALITCCMYCYRKKSKETFTGSEKTLIFFKASWCGHCKRFQPVWDEFKQELEKENIPIKLAEYDVDDEATKPLLEAHNVRGFPTVLLEENGKDDVVFTRNRTVDDLKSFCQENL